MRAVNLIPAEQREGSGSLTGRSGGAALIVLALIAGLALLAVLYGSAKHSESNGRAELATVNAEVATARAEIGRFAPYTGFIAMVNQRTQAISQLVAARFDWSHAFNELGRVLPHGAALTTLHGQVGGGTGAGSTPSPSPSPSPSATAASGATPTSATPPGSTPTFAITGCATSQSEVAQTLERLRLIDGVSTVSLQSSVTTPPVGKGTGASGSSGTSSASAGSGGCGAGRATFSAQIVFAGLPSAPVTSAPGATQVSNQTGGGR